MKAQLSLILALASTAVAELTLYTGGVTTTSATTTSTAAGTAYTGYPAYDPTTLDPPTPPSPPVTTYTLPIPADDTTLAASNYTLSVAQRGNFLGFSIELSVANTILGSHSTALKVPFLNYLSTIRTRAGQGAIVRVGGNTQESSTLYTQGLDDGAMIDKITSNLTTTPTINYSSDLFYAMSNISALVDTEWYFGLPFNKTDVENQIPNIPEVATYAQRILGDRLLGLQLGNEPDLYSDHDKRGTGYGPSNFTTEFNEIKTDILESATLENTAFLVGPSICCEVAGFELDDVLTAGWLTDNVENLAIVAVQHYPDNNCGVNGRVVDVQTAFSNYLNHTSATSLVEPYLAGTAEILAAGKSIMMMEFNTASCGGFAGLSDSFGAAMWMVDYALQMAVSNMTQALMHIGGQGVYYNAFTPAPSTDAALGYEWTTGAVMYSTLVVAEAFGSSNTSQIIDLKADSDNIYHPAYAIYENGVPTRAVLVNFVSDSTGASDLTVTLEIDGGTLPQGTVQVKYLAASSVAEKYDITWANQTFRSSFASDGSLYNTEEIVTITCDTTNNNCAIPLKAPSIAVVFLTNASLTESTGSADVTSTFATTVVAVGTATVDVGQLSTGNGQAGAASTLGSNSDSSTADAIKLQIGGSIGLVLIGMGIGFGYMW